MAGMLKDLAPPVKGSLGNNPLVARLSGEPEPVKTITPEPSLEAPAMEPVTQEPPVEPQKPQEPVEEPVLSKEPTEPVQDPWKPWKEKFQDRDVNEVLQEYDQFAQERESLKVQLDERETAVREYQEKLIAYDAVNDPDYVKNAREPVAEAYDVYMSVCLGDDTLAKEIYALQKNKELDPKERIAKLKGKLDEYGIPMDSIVRAYQGYEKATKAAEEFKANYAKHRAEREKAHVAKMEEDNKNRVETMRRTYNTAAFRAGEKLKEMGMTYLEGYDEAAREFRGNIEKALSGAGGPDVEQETMYNIIGRLAAKNHKTIEAKLKRLEELEAASRSRPKEEPKGNQAPQAKPNNPLLKHMGLER